MIRDITLGQYYPGEFMGAQAGRQRVKIIATLLFHDRAIHRQMTS